MFIYHYIWQEKDPSQGADIAAAPLTITAMRERVIDFLKPFQHTGLVVMVKKPTKDNSWPTFNIIWPFSAELWLLILISFIVVRFALFIALPGYIESRLLDKE